jgi:hypothetical protein
MIIGLTTYSSSSEVYTVVVVVVVVVWKYQMAVPVQYHPINGASTIEIEDEILWFSQLKYVH